MEKKKETNVVAIVGFVFAIISIFTLGLVSSVGLTLSIIGLCIHKKYKSGLKGLAITGVVISSIFFVLFWVLVIVTPNDTNSSSTTPSTSIEEKVQPKKVEPKKIVVSDLSGVSKDDAKVWCNNNALNCDFKDEYNEEIPAGNFISQSIPANTEINPNEKIVITYSLGHQETIGEKNAIRKAKDYLRVMAFSYSGLVRQLEFEGFSNAEATYAVDRCGADWNEQAGKKAKEYISVMAFSREGLINQLEFEGFTYEEAVYGVTQVGY